MRASILPATEQDLDAMLGIYTPFVLHTAVSFETEPPTRSQFLERLAKVQAQAPWLACHLDGEVAGYAYASAHRDRAAYQWNREFSVYVGEAFRRRKVAHALYHALASLCAMQGYVNALAGIALPNEASVRFHESCGFVKAAQFHRVGHKLGRWHDVGWWEWRFAETDVPASIRTEWKPLLFSAEGLKAIQAAEAIIR